MTLVAPYGAALARAFVNAGIYGFVGATLSDLYFAIATFAVFWYGIFVPMYFVPFMGTPPMLSATTLFVQSTFAVFVHAILGAVLGIAFVRIAGIRQLVVVNGGVVPLIMLATSFAAVATLFIVGALSPATFLYGIVGINLYVALVLGLLFAAAALVTIAIAARQPAPRDYASSAYALSFVLFVLAVELVSRITVPGTVATVLSTAAIVVLSGVLLIVGYAIERRWSSPKGRFFVVPVGSGCTNFLRALIFVSLVGGYFWALGYVLRETTSDNAVAMLGVLGYAWWYLGAGVLIFAAAVIVWLCCYPVETEQGEIAEVEMTPEIRGEQRIYGSARQRLGARSMNFDF